MPEIAEREAKESSVRRIRLSRGPRAPGSRFRRSQRRVGLRDASPREVAPRFGEREDRGVSSRPGPPRADEMLFFTPS